MGSVVLPHLVSGWHVDQAIMSEEERLVIIRFGRDWDPDCMRQDEVLYRTFLRSSPAPFPVKLHTVCPVICGIKMGDSYSLDTLAPY